MKGSYVIFSLVLFATPIHAQDISSSQESVDLEALYQQIDDAISLSSQYVAERERQISACRDSFLMEKIQEKRLLTAEKLFQPYRNDSALHYVNLCIILSDSLHRPDLVGRFRSLLAMQCSKTNMQSESLEQLRLVNRSALDKNHLCIITVHGCTSMVNLLLLPNVKVYVRAISISRTSIVIR